MYVIDCLADSERDPPATAKRVCIHILLLPLIDISFPSLCEDNRPPPKKKKYKTFIKLRIEHQQGVLAFITTTVSLQFYCNAELKQI